MHASKIRCDSYYTNFFFCTFCPLNSALGHGVARASVGLEQTNNFHGRRTITASGAARAGLAWSLMPASQRGARLDLRRVSLKEEHKGLGPPHPVQVRKRT
jgi:hypothetical protein